MRRPVAAAVLVAALSMLGAPAAWAGDSAAPDPVATEVAPAAPVEPAPVEPDPVEPAPDPDPVEAPPPDPGEPAPPVEAPVVEDPVTPAPDPVAPAPVTPAPAPVDPTTPAPVTTEPAPPTATDTASPTVSPTDTTPPTTAPPVTAAPTTNIDITTVNVDVDLDDHSDRSIHIENNSTTTFNTTFNVVGDQYSSVYWWRDEDGYTYRARDLDCSDFDTQPDAQRVFDAAGNNAYWLDGNGNGVACEALSGEFTKDTATRLGVRKGGQVDVYPVGGVATGRAA